MIKGNNSKGRLQTQRPKQSKKKTTKGAEKECQQEPIIEINSYILMSLAEREIPCRQI
jgi:hypothetical protein